MAWIVDIHGGQVILVFSWVVMGIGILIGSARLVSRWHFNRRWRASDVTFLFGEAAIIVVQVLTIVELFTPNRERVVCEVGRRLIYVATLDTITWIGLTLIRTSILLLFAEIFTYQSDRIAVWIGVASSILVTVICIPIILWACVPWVSKNDPKDVGFSEALCRDVQRPFTITSASVALFLDLYVIAIPINRIVRLNMPRRKKVLVFLNVAIGGLAVAVSAARLGDVITHDSASSLICMRVMRNIILCTFEGEIVNIAGSLICLHPLMNRIVQAWRNGRWVRDQSRGTKTCERRPYGSLLPLWRCIQGCKCCRALQWMSWMPKREINEEWPRNTVESGAQRDFEWRCGGWEQWRDGSASAMVKDQSHLNQPRAGSVMDESRRESGVNGTTGRHALQNLERLRSRSLVVDGRNVVVEEGGVMGRVDAELYTAMDDSLDDVEKRQDGREGGEES